MINTTGNNMSVGGFATIVYGFFYKEKLLQLTVQGTDISVVASLFIT